MLLDPRIADPFARRPIRVSMGHTLTVPWARAERWPDVLADVRAAGFTVAALTPGDGAIPIDRLPATGRIALLLGAEGAGLSEPALAGGDRPARPDPDGAGRRLAERGGRQRHCVPPRRCDNRAMSEGHIEVPGGRVWYERLGGGDGTPVLTLHGGPGAAHYYIRRSPSGWRRHRPVILYDQLGCGLSEKPDDPRCGRSTASSARSTRCARRSGSSTLPPVRAVVGRLARDRVPVPRGTTGIERRHPGRDVGEHRQFTGEARG